MERLLVIGNGMAGLRLVEEVTKRAPGRFAITMVGKESQPAYNRVLLSSLLAGDIGEEEIRLKDRGWYAEHAIALITGDAAVRLDPDARAVEFNSGRRLDYDRLVLATGSNPLRPPIPGLDLPGDADEATVKERVRPMPGGLLYSPNDTDGTLIVALVGTAPIAAGPLLELQFDRCKGTPAPTAADLRCTVEQASDDQGHLLAKGTECAVALGARKEKEK